MEHDLTHIIYKVCQWYIKRYFSESNAAVKQPPTEESVQTIFQPPALTIVFREGKATEEAVKEIADIYINRHAYTPIVESPTHEEREYLKFKNINFEKLEKITL